MKWFSIIGSSLLLLFLIYFSFYFIGLEGDVFQDYKFTRDQFSQKKNRAPVVATKIIPVEENNVQMTPNKENKRRPWKQQKELALKENTACDLFLKEILPNDNLIDPEDPFYHDKQMVMKKLKDVLTKTLWRHKIGEAYEFLGTSFPVKEELSIEEIYQELVQLDSYCRDFKALNFIDTVLEASRLYDWDKKTKEKVLAILMENMRPILGKHYSTTNMGYIVSLFEGLIRSRILSSDYSEEVKSFYKRMLEHEDLFLKTYNESGAELEKEETLRHYFKENQRLGEELQDMILLIQNTAN